MYTSQNQFYNFAAANNSFGVGGLSGLGWGGVEWGGVRYVDSYFSDIGVIAYPLSTMTL